jgi:hypothetical protein
VYGQSVRLPLGRGLRDCYLIERTRFLKGVTGRIFETIDFTEASKSFIYNFLSKAVKNEKTIIVLRKSRY